MGLIRSKLPQVDLRELMAFESFGHSFPYLLSDKQKFSDLKTVFVLTKKLVSYLVLAWK